jgi:hypothetical protein
MSGADVSAIDVAAKDLDRPMTAPSTAPILVVVGTGTFGLTLGEAFEKANDDPGGAHAGLAALEIGVGLRNGEQAVIIIYGRQEHSHRQPANGALI